MINSILINNQPLGELPKDLYIPPEALQVFLETFEGPLDLLLYLIRKQNLDILEIPIAKITEQYISYINAMQVLNIELAGEYLLMAAMLLEIKSRLLLPRKTDENLPDESADDDPRQELIQRLLEYEKIKQAGINLNALPQAMRDYLWVDILIEESAPELPQIVPLDLQKAWHTLLLRSLQAQNQHQIQKQELSVREHMTQILRILRDNGRSNFFSLFNLEWGVSHVVVNFIAILELGKEGMINIDQLASSEIFIELS